MAAEAALTSQTCVVAADEFEFETLEQNNGLASIIRFKLPAPSYNAGDLLLVLSGTDIHFHGLIGSVTEDGYAIAADRRGSLLPATVQ